MEPEKWVIYNKGFKKYWNVYEGWTTRERATLYSKKFDLDKRDHMDGVWLLCRTNNPDPTKEEISKYEEICNPDLGIPYPDKAKAQRESMNEALEFDEKQRHKE